MKEYMRKDKAETETENETQTKNSIKDYFPNWHFYALSSTRKDFFDVESSVIKIPDGDALVALQQRFENNFMIAPIYDFLMDVVIDIELKLIGEQGPNLLHKTEKKVINAYFNQLGNQVKDRSKIDDAKDYCIYMIEKNSKPIEKFKYLNNLKQIGITLSKLLQGDFS